MDPNQPALTPAAAPGETTNDPALEIMRELINAKAGYDVAKYNQQIEIFRRATNKAALGRANDGVFTAHKRLMDAELRAAQFLQSRGLR